MKTKLLKFGNCLLGFCAVAGCVTQLNAQAVNFEWAKRIGGTGADNGCSIAVDASANVYTIGCFSGTADFDPGAGTYNLTSAGFNDIFISKLDSSGNFIWAKIIGGSAYNDCGFSIAVDAAGNVYSTGGFNGTVDFDPGAGVFNLTSMSNWDIFISKLDSSGNFVWAKQASSINGEGYSMAIDASNNIYLLGRFNNIGYFDAITISSGLVDAIFISKLDSSGNFLWAAATGGTWVNYNTYDHSIAVHASSVYITGEFSDTVDFDPGAGITYLASSGGRDIYTVKYDTSGNFLWVKGMGGALDDQGYSIAVDSFENIFTTGSFNATADFDPGVGTFNLTSAGQRDIFISKLDSSGNFIWAKQLGGIGTDEPWSIALDASSNVYTAGWFANTVDFDPGPGTFAMTSTGGYDIFVLQLDFSGNFAWAKKMGGIAADVGNSIAIDYSSSVYTTGFFYGTADFDPGVAIFNLSHAGNGDVFVHKMSQSPTGISEPVLQNSFELFPNPTTEQFSVFIPKLREQLSGKKEIEIYNVFGEKIYGLTLVSDKTEINLSNQPAGIYFVQMRTNGRIFNQKLIIQK